MAAAAAHRLPDGQGRRWSGDRLVRAASTARAWHPRTAVRSVLDPNMNVNLAAAVVASVLAALGLALRRAMGRSLATHRVFALCLAAFALGAALMKALFPGGLAMYRHYTQGPPQPVIEAATYAVERGVSVEVAQAMIQGGSFVRHLPPGASFDDLLGALVLGGLALVLWGIKAFRDECVRR